MKKQLHIFIIILMLGFFFAPVRSYGCGTDSENSCCKKQNSSKIEKKQCCNGSHSKDKEKGCGGKCGHSNCTTSSVTFSIIFFNEIQFKNNNVNCYIEKSKFFHSETYISSGFTSVWLPPKIN